MAIRTSMASLVNSIPLPLQPTAVRSVFFLAFLAIQIQLVCIAGIRADDGDVLARQLRSREFDYFKLALQWPGTYCRKTRHCCSSNGCCRGSNAPTGFTIHGLWPDYNDGTWPSCCHGKRFELKEVKTLLGALNKYWPSLSCSSSSNCHGGKGLFWEHEWEKHGTCCSAVTGDEYSYFLMALNIYFKYNVTEVLREAGYVPSNSEKYPLGGIITAIQNAFNTTPELECSKGAVEELRLCFTKKFELRDCAADASNGIISKKSCPQYVSLPNYSSSSRLGSNEPEPQLPESKLQSSI